MIYMLHASLLAEKSGRLEKTQAHFHSSDVAS